MRAVRGGEIAMIFQEPMTSLSPDPHVSAEQIGGRYAGSTSWLGRKTALPRALAIEAAASIVGNAQSATAL